MLYQLGRHSLNEMGISPLIGAKKPAQPLLKQPGEQMSEYAWTVEGLHKLYFGPGAESAAKLDASHLHNEMGKAFPVYKKVEITDYQINQLAFKTASVVEEDAKLGKTYIFTEKTIVEFAKKLKEGDV